MGLFCKEDRDDQDTGCKGHLEMLEQNDRIARDIEGFFSFTPGVSNVHVFVCRMGAMAVLKDLQTAEDLPAHKLHGTKKKPSCLIRR